MAQPLDEVVLLLPGQRIGGDQGDVDVAAAVLVAAEGHRSGGVGADQVAAEGFPRLGDERGQVVLDERAGSAGVTRGSHRIPAGRATATPGRPQTMAVANSRRSSSAADVVAADRDRADGVGRAPRPRPRRRRRPRRRSRRRSRPGEVEVAAQRRIRQSRSGVLEQHGAPAAADAAAAGRCRARARWPRRCRRRPVRVDPPRPAQRLRQVDAVHGGLVGHPAEPEAVGPVVRAPGRGRCRRLPRAAACRSSRGRPR